MSLAWLRVYSSVEPDDSVEPDNFVEPDDSVEPDNSVEPDVTVIKLMSTSLCSYSK